MHLGRLTLTLFLSGAMGFSTANALAQETPSTPPEKKKVALEKLADGLGPQAEELDRLFKLLEEDNNRLLKALENYQRFLDGWRYEIYVNMRARYLETRKSGGIRKVNQFENAQWVEIPWTVNDELEISYLQDAFWFGGLVEKKNNGEYFRGYRLYVRKEKDREVPFLEVVVLDENNEQKIKLFDITQDEYKKIMESIVQGREAEQWYFRKRVFKEYELFMTDYFKKEGHAYFKGTFGDIVQELKKRINDEDIDVKKYLVAALPAFAQYSDSDAIPIPNPFKKKEEKKTE